MKKLILFLTMVIAVSTKAQVPCAQSLEKGTALDTAKYKVTYQLMYKNHPADKTALYRNILIFPCATA